MDSIFRPILSSGGNTVFPARGAQEGVFALRIGLLPAFPARYTGPIPKARFRGSREPSDRRSVGPSKRGFREKLTPFLGNRGYALFVRQPFPSFSKGGCRDRHYRFHSRHRRAPRRDRLPVPAGPPQEPAPLEARAVPALSSQEPLGLGSVKQLLGALARQTWYHRVLI